MPEQEPNKEIILEQAKHALVQALEKDTIDLAEFETTMNTVKEAIRLWYPDEAQRETLFRDLEPQINALKSGLTTAASVEQQNRIQQLIKTGFRAALSILAQAK